jgi:hypothetical protein
MSDPLVTCDNAYLSLESIIKLLVRDADCAPYVECGNEGWESLVKRLFSVLDDGTLALNVCDCEEGGV